MSKVYQQLMSKFSKKKQYPVEEIKTILMATIRVRLFVYPNVVEIIEGGTLK